MPDTQTKWRKGNGWGSVVSDVLPPDGLNGSADVEAYGGYLIAESIAPSMIPLVAAAPEMREVLRSLIAEDPCAPNDPRMAAAIAILAKIA